jgi:hypothetical protein
MRHRHPDLCAPKQPDLTPRQRWIAAQRLAAGDTIRMAAVMANTKAAVLSLLLGEDPEFQGLIEDCRAVHAMSRDAWRARAEAYARDAAERAMVDGRVSTLNLCLKATGLLAGTAEDADADEDPVQAWMDGLSDEEWAEYEALDNEIEEPAEAEDAGADVGAAAPGQALTVQSVPVTPVAPADAAPVPARGLPDIAELAAGPTPLPISQTAAAGAASSPSTARKITVTADFPGRPAPSTPFPRSSLCRESPARGLPPATAGP